MEPQTPHPEQLEGEIFLENVDPRTDAYLKIDYKTKRLGAVAYDVNGKPIVGMCPVFVSLKEDRLMAGFLG